MRIFLALLLIVVLGVGGYFWYWQRKLEPIMAAEGVKLILTPYELKPFTGSKRQINLGFSQFELPAAVPGDPVMVDSTLFVVMEHGEPPFQITICPPISESDKELSGPLSQYSQLSGEKIDSLFEFKKRALIAQPFTVWALPALGKRKAVSEAVLLSIKTLMAHSASKIQFSETAKIGALIFTESDKTIITMFDKQKRVSQIILVVQGTTDIDQFLSVLIPSYQFTSTDTMEAKWREQAKEAGLRSRKITAPKGDSMPDTERMIKVKEEIQRRRNLRKPGDG